MVISFSAGFSYSVLMWPRFAVQKWRKRSAHGYFYCLEVEKEVSTWIFLMSGSGERGQHMGNFFLSGSGERGQHMVTLLVGG